MKSISKNNYPEWIVDFFDKNLSESESIELMDFLAQDETAFEEFMEYKSVVESNISDTEGDIDLPSFEHLKVVENYPVPKCEYDVIAYVENDLPSDEYAGFERKLKTSANLQKKVALYRLTRQSLEVFVTPDFSELKRKPKFFTLSSAVYVAASVAAVLVLYFSIPIDQEKYSGMAALSSSSHTIYFSEKPRYSDSTNLGKAYQATSFNHPVNQAMSPRSTEKMGKMPSTEIAGIPLSDDNNIYFIDDIRTDYLVALKSMQHSEINNHNTSGNGKNILNNVADFLGISKMGERARNIENIADKGLYAYQFITGK